MSNYYTRNSRYSNLDNPHMYVLQVTSTSNKYALGKPVLDGNYQSQDKVCSPAFMIASQLGAVSTTNSGTTAATHCGTYMEVEAGTGKRFVGWRLPTKQEIEVIIGYQDGTYTNGVTMVTVLGGAYYWALDGTTANVPSGSGGSTTTDNGNQCATATTYVVDCRNHILQGIWRVRVVNYGGNAFLRSVYHGFV